MGNAVSTYHAYPAMLQNGSDFKTRALRCFWAVFALFFLTGCSVESVHKAGNNPKEQNETHDDGRLLVYDFGVIRPRSEQSHVFTLKNPTDTDWRISEIVENCSCTVAKTLTDVIPAGGSLDVELTYRAGTEFTNDKRDTIVHFEQEDVLPITLRVESKIRPQIVVQPANLSVSAYEPDKKIQQTVVVHDWSDAGLKTVSSRSDDSWISVSAPRQDRTTDTEAPFLPWTGTLVIDTKGLSSGKHSGRVDITAREKDLEYSTYLTVSLDIASPVRVVPSNLFFGEIQPNETATIQCTLFIVPNNTGDTDSSHWESIVIDSDLPSDTLEAEIVRESDVRGTLTVNLTPKTSDRLQGNVIVKLGNGRYKELVLPVNAYVKREPLTSQERKANCDENVE